MRLFFILTTFIVFLNAQIVNFSEEKYISAIEKSVFKIGKIEFLDDEIKLTYDNFKEVLIIKNDELFIQKDEKVSKFDVENQTILKMVFLLIKSIYNDEFEILKDFFEMNNVDGTYFLKPKEQLKDFIQKVEFKKSKKVEFIKIYMQDGNKTIIRETDD